MFVNLFWAAISKVIIYNTFVNLGRGMFYIFYHLELDEDINTSLSLSPTTWTVKRGWGTREEEIQGILANFYLWKH